MSPSSSPTIQSDFLEVLIPTFEDVRQFSLGVNEMNVSQFPFSFSLKTIDTLLHIS